MGMHRTRLKLRSITAVAALLGFTLLSLPALAQGTPEQRAACEQDAMRLCNQYVPDVARITACMSANRRHLTPRCRAAFQGGAKRKKKTRRAVD